MRATIIRPGVPGQSEPYAQLDEDGRVMPMGLNLGETLEVGITGEAEYISSSSSGLWKFTADEEV